MNPRSVLPLLFILVVSSAGAAQFRSVVDAMAIKASAAHTNNGWEDTTKITGVKWKWPYYESGAHDHSMVGTTRVGRSKNPHIGATEVVVSGARSMISSVSIRVVNESIGVDALGAGKATKIRSTCDESSSISSVEFYKLEKPGYKPLFVSYQSSSGAGGAGSVELGVSYTIDDALGMYSGPCTAR